MMLAVVVAVIGCIVVAAFGIGFIRDSMIQDRIAKVRNLTEVSRDVAKGFYQREQKGEFDQATAQDLALKVMNGLHFDKDEYFFCYKFDGTLLMFPPKPERVGKNFMDLRDENGVYFIRKLIDVAKAGGGVVFYQKPRPGSETSIDKVAYSIPFEPWGWEIGTGIYIDDVDSEFYAIAGKFALIVLLIGGVTAAIVVSLARNISRPLVRLVAITDRIAHEDLAVDVTETERRDEIGALATTIRSLRDIAREAVDLRVRQEQERLRNVQSSIDAAEFVTTGSEQLSSSAEQLNSGVSEQASATEQAASSVEEMASNVKRTAENAGQTEKIASQSAKDAQLSGEAVKRAAAAMQTIAQKIGIVQEIARQTDLLALNAAVEAARAGEHGRGFAVVASEVRKLSVRSQTAAAEINDLATETVNLAKDAGQRLDELVPNIRRTAILVEEISSACSEQNVGIQHINIAIQQLHKVTQQNALAAEQMTETSVELASHAEQLQETIANFRSQGDTSAPAPKPDFHPATTGTVERPSKKRTEAVKAKRQNSKDGGVYTLH